MRALAAAAAALVSSSCAVWVEGSFDDVSFSPTATAVAILDAHDVLQRDGAFIPVERPRADKRVHLWLSAADVPKDEDWQHLEDERLLEVKKQLATHDLLVLRDVPFDPLSDGDDVNNEEAEFDSFLLHRRPDNDEVFGEGLGGRVTVSVEPQQVEDADPRGGVFNAKVFVKRERDVGQPGNDVATGEVIFTVALPFAPERLAEADFSFVAPIAACGAERGPFDAAACAAVEREPIVDATGVH